MAQAHFRWQQTRGTVLGLMVGWAALSGCRPTGRRALLEGDRFLQAGRLGEAVPMLERAAADLQTDGAAWNHLGRAYHESGRISDARKAYLRALQADRNLFDAHFNLGQLALESGAWRDAEAGFRTWLGAGQIGAVPASVAIAWRGLGIAQLRQGNLPDAERSFGSALRVDDKDAESWNAVGLIRQQRRQYRDAFNTFTYAARLSPQFAAPRLNAAIIAQQYLNDRRAALDYYRAYLALNPPDAAAITQLIAQLEPHVGAVGGPAELFADRTNAVATSNPSPGGSRGVAGSSIAPAATAITSAPPAVVKTPARTPATASTPTPALNGRRGGAIPGEPAPAADSPPGRRPAAPELSGPTSVSPPARPITTITIPVNPPIVTAPDTPVVVLTSPTTPPSSTVSPITARPPETTPAATSPALPPPVPANSPLEVIQVAERPVIRPAQDPAPAASVPATTESPTLPLASDNPVLGPESNRIAPARTETTGGTTDSTKRSLWTRANPVNWFKRDRSTAPTQTTSKPITPLEFPPYDPTAPAMSAPPPTPVPAAPPIRKPRAREIAVATTPRSAPAAEIPAATAPLEKPKPVFERYTRHVNTAPKSGDHTAAVREFETGLAAHRRDDLAAAATGYQQAVSLDPAYFEAQYNLSLAAIAQNNLPLALRAAETATTLRPADPGARYQFAVVLLRSRYPAEAAAEMEEVARLQQTNSASHLAAATLYANDLQEPERARAHYEKVLALEPTHPQADTIRRWLAGNPAK